MIEQCPHCNKTLNFSEAQTAKIAGALAKLPPGKLLKLGCPHCQKPIELSADGSTPAAQGAAETAPAKSAAPAVPKPINPPPEPPHPPNLDWLESGDFADKAVVEDMPLALILVKEGEVRDQLVKNLAGAYKVVFPSSADDAIERMRFVNYAVVAYQTSYDSQPFADSTFHTHMKNLPMVRRRHMFYLLIGPDFHTLYDLQALAYSANVVINEKDMKHFEVIGRKAYQDYQDLFGPYIETLKALGKQ